MHEMGVLTTVDRAGFAAYCQCYGRWVEAEQKLKETPLFFKTQTGYTQQSPWLSVANKQLELMGRYMTEFGLTPASCARVMAQIEAATEPDRVSRVELVVVSRDADGNWVDRPLEDTTPVGRSLDDAARIAGPTRIYLDEGL
jgi:P27 family predicted phage terminase small subunit